MSLSKFRKPSLLDKHNAQEVARLEALEKMEQAVKENEVEEKVKKKIIKRLN